MGRETSFCVDLAAARGTLDMNDEQYIHGTDSDEQRRLSLLNDLLNDASLKAMRLEGGEKILDVGSGLGQLAHAMARAASPAGKVVGIERDPKQLAEARQLADKSGGKDRVEFRQGDATALPLAGEEWGSFDLAHSRFLLEHVPDPQGVVSAMVKALRPGGRIILEDDDHDVLRLWPEPEGIYKLWRAYMDVYRKLGNDPFVGRHLVAMIREAGAEPVRNDWLFFGSCSGHPAFEVFVENFVGVIGGARRSILDVSAVEPDEFDRAIDGLRKWGQRSDAALWYATFWAEGLRPEDAAP